MEEIAYPLSIASADSLSPSRQCRLANIAHLLLDILYLSSHKNKRLTMGNGR